MKAIAALQLGVTAVSVAESIAATPKLKLKDKDGQNIRAVGEAQVEVHPPRDAKQPLFFMLQSLLQQLPGVIVQGIPSVERAVINQDKDKKCAPLTRPAFLVGCTGLDRGCPDALSETIPSRLEEAFIT